jgi:hypothetical protein
VKKNKTAKLESTSSELDDFFGRPALLKGENRESYRNLQRELSKILRPENLLDTIEVQEAVDDIWEGRRLQTMGTKLIDAERRKAVEFLTSSRFGYVSEAHEEWFESLAGKPYPDGMTEAEVLKKMGLSKELVQARALLQAAEDLAVVNRLASSRVAARKASLKDYARRKRLEAKERRLADKVKLQQSNDNEPTEHRKKPDKKSSW